MSELANYSIETDQTVLLSFVNGSTRRISVDELAVHLAGPDLARVKAALKLRQDFIKKHMPKAVFALIFSSAMAFFAIGGTTVADNWKPLTGPSAAPQNLTAPTRYVGLASTPPEQVVAAKNKPAGPDLDDSTVQSSTAGRTSEPKRQSPRTSGHSANGNLANVTNAIVPPLTAPISAITQVVTLSPLSAPSPAPSPSASPQAQPTTLEAPVVSAPAVTK